MSYTYFLKARDMDSTKMQYILL